MSNKRKAFGLALICVLYFGLSCPAFGQTRCNMVSEHCIDLTSLAGSGGTVEVPSNTTRFTSEAVSICLTPEGVETPPVDMVWVIDQSGSMVGNDPTFYAPTATLTSVRKLFELAPGSLGGLVPFAKIPCSQHGLYGISDSVNLMSDVQNNLADGTAPPMFDDDSDWTGLDGTSALSCGDGTGNMENDDYEHGTNYHQSLTTANSLANSGSNSKKAIIFITDGEPSGDADKKGSLLNDYNKWIEAGIDIVPVYSIFIGGDSTDIDDPDSPAGRLTHLATLTGGGYFSVQADDPPALEWIMRHVVQEVVSPAIPFSTILQNTTMGQTSSADSTDHTQLENGQYQVVLDDIVGIQPGENDIVVTSISTKNGVQQDPVVFNITIDARGTPYPNLGDADPSVVPDSLFDITCVGPSTLTSTNDAFTPIDTLFLPADEFGMVLYTPSGIQDPPISVTAPLSADAETFTLNYYQSDTIWRALADFSLTSGAGTPGNITVEGQRNDSLYLKWVHPRDDQDSAVTTLLVDPYPPDIGAQIWFADSLTLGDTVTSFTRGATPVYVIVQDQLPLLEQFAYTVNLVTVGGDSRTIKLELMNGLLVGSIPADYEALNTNDSALQINLSGDNLVASYTDPLYSENVQATASYPGVSVEPPTANPFSGTFFKDDTTFTLSTTTIGASIRYTIDGTEPSNTHGLDTLPHYITTSTVVKAVAYLQHSLTNFAMSNIVQIVYNSRDQVGTPHAVPTGTYFSNDILITLEPNNPIDSIYYTIDNSDPVSSGIRYTTPITITDTTILKFYAKRFPATPSTVVTEIYIKRDTLDIPVLEPATTDFFGDTAITMTHPETGVRIFYTLDESEPLSDDKLYVSSNKPVVTGPTTIRARTYPPINSDAWVISPAVTEVYTPIVATPVAVPGDTSFISELLAYLSTPTFGASIHYTLNGDTPTKDSPQYTQALPFTETKTIKVIAVKPLWANSAVLEVVYTKFPAQSTLEILDQNLKPMEYLTERTASFMVVVTAPEPTLGQIHPVAYTLSNGDTTTLTLTPVGRVGDKYQFTGSVPFSVGSANTSNSTVEASVFDSVYVQWVNEKDARDTAYDIIAVRPYPRQPMVYFSDSLTAGEPVTEYEIVDDIVYVIVRDQPRAPGLDYEVTLVTETLYGADPDTITVPLVEFESGVFGAAVPVDRTLTKDAGDGTLQLLPGDVIHASYTDPLDGESAGGEVDYGEPGEITGVITFTDSQGYVLEDGAVWRPDEDFIHIKYVDDYTNIPKTFTVLIKNTNGIGKETFDTVTVTLDSTNVVQTDSIGTWTLAIPMNEAQHTDPSNEVVEIFFKGEVTVQVTTHARDFTPLTIIEDNLLVAYPDEEEEITITDVSGGTVLWETPTVKIVVDDQNFSNIPDLPDTIMVNVRSKNTQDVISLMLIEDENGNYVGTFDQVEGDVNNTDLELTTKSSDCIIVTYIDPVYPEIQNKPVQTCFIEDQTRTVYFAEESGGEAITTLDEDDEGNSSFIVVVEGPSEKQNEIDTMKVVLTAQNGDQITVDAIETGVHTGVYESVEIPFGFVSSPDKGDARLEGTLNSATADNVLSLDAVILGTTDSSRLEIEAAFVPVDSVKIIDGNSNGRGDTIFVYFQEPLGALPSEITSINWPRNEEDGAFTAELDKSEIVFREKKNGSIDSSVVLIVLDKEFEFGETSKYEPEPGRITLPDNPVFQGQTLQIEDGMGAVVVEANLYPSGTAVEDIGDGDKLFQPDTLTITLSEEIELEKETEENWNQVFRFSRPGSDTSFSLIMLGLPTTSDGLTYEIIVTNERGVRRPHIGDEIFIDKDAPVMDVRGNDPSEAPKNIEGENPVKAVYTFGVLNPIEGLGQNSPQAYAVMNVDEDGNTIFTTTGRNDDVQMWLAPVGWDPDKGIVDARDYKQLCDGGAEGGRDLSYSKYTGRCRPMSAVKVCSEEAYTAYVKIFDNHGKFINSSVVKWGYCGEKDNERAYGTMACDKGALSFLYWNQEDVEGNLVGNGVYYYKILFSYEKAKQSLIYEKQGIVRHDDYKNDCRE